MSLVNLRGYAPNQVIRETSRRSHHESAPPRRVNVRTCEHGFEAPVIEIVVFQPFEDGGGIARKIETVLRHTECPH